MEAETGMADTGNYQELEKNKQNILPWSLRKEPALLTPGFEFCKTRLWTQISGILASSVTVRKEISVVLRH